MKLLANHEQIFAIGCAEYFVCNARASYLDLF